MRWRNHTITRTFTEIGEQNEDKETDDVPNENMELFIIILLATIGISSIGILLVIRKFYQNAAEVSLETGNKKRKKRNLKHNPKRRET